MSEQTNSTPAQSTEASSQSSQTTGQSSELSKLSQGQEGSILSNAASVTTHQADPVTQTPPKSNESTKDIPIANASTQDEEYDLELPKDSLLTSEDLNEIAEEAGRLNLSKADAEKLIATREAAYKKGMTKAQAEYQTKIQEAAKEIKSHPDFIGENKVKSFESINRVVKTFGDENFIKALSSPEIGNNLALALFLKRLGDAMAPDSIEGKGSSVPTIDNKEAALEKLYPDFFKKA